MAQAAEPLEAGVADTGALQCGGKVIGVELGIVARPRDGADVGGEACLTPWACSRAMNSSCGRVEWPTVKTMRLLALRLEVRRAWGAAVRCDAVFRFGIAREGNAMPLISE